MKRHLARRLLATTLSLTFILSVSAQALTLEQAQALLLTYSINPVTEEVLEQTTIEDMLGVLGDRYTEYYSAEAYQAFLDTMTDTAMVGIGVSCSVTDDGALIETVYEGSAAAQAGLESGDLITAVDYEDIVGYGSTALTNLLRGEAGTSVRVTYRRANATRSVTLVRQEFVIPSTTTELLDDHIAYITCDTFGSDTLAHLDEGFVAYASSANRWIVDLMGNTGGDVAVATEAASYFTGSGSVAYLVDSDGLITPFTPTDDAQTLYPVIVLTDSATASASELYAAAVRDSNSGLIVGWRTYGKGTAQVLLDESVYPEFFDGDAMKISAYEFYSADGLSTNSIGVIPDLMVDPNLADNVAILLSSPNPAGDTTGYLRVDFGWRWMIDIAQATSEEYLPAFTALLEAIPSTASFWVGTGGTDGWAATTTEEVAATYGLTLDDRSFTDTIDSPYATEIDLLATYYILLGAGDGTFSPTAELTRGQLCALLAQALNCAVPTGESGFTDVPSDHPYSAAITALTSMGLVNGISDDTFLPDDIVTHEQFVTILGRLGTDLSLGLNNVLGNRTEESPASEALDSYASWSEPYVWLMAEALTYYGAPYTMLWEDDLADIDPDAATTREEAAYVLYTLLSVIGILPA